MGKVKLTLRNLNPPPTPTRLRAFYASNGDPRQPPPPLVGALLVADLLRHKQNDRTRRLCALPGRHVKAVAPHCLVDKDQVGGPVDAVDAVTAETGQLHVADGGAGLVGEEEDGGGAGSGDGSGLPCRGSILQVGGASLPSAVVVSMLVVDICGVNPCCSCRWS